MSSVSPLRAFGPHRVHHPFEGKVDTRRRRKLKDVARTLPRAPGVYFFHGFQDRLLYIGKAKCLRERVRSYFAETSHPRPPKLRRLLAEITRLDWEECGSELEALLLERRLIAERRPLLNHQHNRFEVYPYLLLTDEAFPRLTLTKEEPLSGRMKDEGGGIIDEEDVEEWEEDEGQDDALLHPSSFIPHPSATLPLETPPHLGELPGLYLGPFTTPRVARGTLEAVRLLFPLRTCEGDLKPDAGGHACFYHEIKRCCGPCVAATSQADYARLCDDLIRLLQSGQAPQLEALRARMHRLAEEQRFEEAIQIRDQLQAVEIVAARLQRLQRMREHNNVVIVQPARRNGDSPDERPACVFMVQGGVVRRYVAVHDWRALKSTIREVYASPLPVAVFTAKAELDEMMILDRWLQAHRGEPCCVWMNERGSRQWASNAARQLQAWAKHQHD
ncbi:MAG: UvrB/UvrC motif-containing protein [Armatimonadota bacterium]|nr:UvrB/UvrC motif-containing protein [Armatimonadota bacterium]